MHRRIKLYIRFQGPAYQYPRPGSFVALVNNFKILGLLEETRVREDPEERGADEKRLRAYQLLEREKIEPPQLGEFSP